MAAGAASCAEVGEPLDVRPAATGYSRTTSSNWGERVTHTTAQDRGARRKAEPPIHSKMADVCLALVAFDVSRLHRIQMQEQLHVVPLHRTQLHAAQAQVLRHTWTLDRLCDRVNLHPSARVPTFIHRNYTGCRTTRNNCDEKHGRTSDASTWDRAAAGTVGCVATQ